MDAMLTLSSQENSMPSWARNRLRNEDGKLHSIFAMRLEAHPRKDEIIKLISGKKETGLTYTQLALQIKQEYCVELGWKFLRAYYIRHFTSGVVKFDYAELPPHEKLANLWKEFFNAMADLEIERQARLMDFKREVERGSPIRDSYKRGNTITLLRDKVLRLGSAVGYYPRMDFTGASIQITDIQVASDGYLPGVSPGLLQLFEGVFGNPSDSGNEPGA